MVPLIEHRDGNIENLNNETLDTESPIQDWGVPAVKAVSEQGWVSTSENRL
jgi:hypothetical protein